MRHRRSSHPLRPLPLRRQALAGPREFPFCPNHPSATASRWGVSRGQGHDPARPEASQLRLEHLGFVFQSFYLLPALTAVENVALPLRLRGVRRSAARAEATAMLAALELGAHVEARPGTLGGGEKQRVSIARALVGRPRVILADEPTASVDARRGREAVELLTSLARRGEQACVVVTHDHRLVESADRVVELNDGRLSTPGA